MMKWWNTVGIFWIFVQTDSGFSRFRVSDSLKLILPLKALKGCVVVACRKSRTLWLSKEKQKHPKLLQMKNLKNSWFFTWKFVVTYSRGRLWQWDEWGRGHWGPGDPDPWGASVSRFPWRKCSHSFITRTGTLYSSNSVHNITNRVVGCPWS